MDRMKHCKTQRERDLLVIEALLRKFGPLSQVEIHELTHFQRSAISGSGRPTTASSSGPVCKGR